MSINPVDANLLGYAPPDSSLPRSVGYEPRLGVHEEFAKLDHVHAIIVERWHYVENTELQNGWTNPVGTVGVFRFLRDPMGFVHIEGKLDAGTVATNTVIYTLPVGYRPQAGHRFPVVTATGGALATLLIQETGNIVVGGVAVTTNLYFSGIIFEADREQIDSFTL